MRGSRYMFEETAEQWVRELLRNGKIEKREDEEIARITREYARQLEEFFHREVLKQLEPSGKASEYERMLLYDSHYINKYLNQTIPGYAGFLSEVLTRAKKAILGN